MLRQPAVAGQFYSRDTEDLRAELDALWPRPAPAPMAALGAVIPHAGYMYSGRTAARVHAQLQPADCYLLLGPNHTGQGCPLALSAARAWKTPLGKVAVNQALAEKLMQLYPGIRRDESAHALEHSLEVQLPFLQAAAATFSIVPLVIGTLDAEKLLALGEALAQAIQESKQACVLIASSDMNHFASLGRTQVLDRMALEQVEKLDPAGLLHAVRQQHISMCGVGPTAAMLQAAVRLGATQAQVVDYSTSAEASGDNARVVGYAGVVVS